MKHKFIKEKKRLINSFKYAINGIIVGIRQEANMKIHLSILIIVLILGFILNITIKEWIICIIMFGLVLSAELVNTSIETTVDLITDKFNIKAKIAKDTAAGSVLIIALTSVVVGIIIFLPKIINLFD